MQKLDKLLVICTVLAFFSACKDKSSTTGSGDGTPPGMVTNISVENMNGKARISYDLPNNEDLLYVKAEFDNNGKPREAKASYFKNSLMVEGFGDTTETEVSLYAVDRGMNESKPANVTVNPKISPVMSTFETIDFTQDFGGINITFENENEGNIKIAAITKDSLGEWVSAENFYTKQREGNFAVRGFDAEEREFGVYLRDRWDNYTDTLVKEIKPLFEKELDKFNFSLVDFPGNAINYNGTFIPSQMWDETVAGGNFWHTSQKSGEAGFPLRISFDLGVKAKLSRFRIWPRQGSWIFGHGNVKKMEIWGSNDPASDGSYEGWTKLALFESHKPSGLPQGQNTNEDVARAQAGEELVFPVDKPAVRYIRFKVISSWGSPAGSANGFAHITEVSFWGQEQE